MFLPNPNTVYPGSSSPATLGSNFESRFRKFAAVAPSYSILFHPYLEKSSLGTTKKSHGAKSGKYGGSRNNWDVVFGQKLMLNMG